MKVTRLLFLILGLLLGWANPLHAASYLTVSVPSGIDHSTFSQLLGKYVDGRGLVDYVSWKNDPDDLNSLDKYIAQFTPIPEPKASSDDEVAALVNLYNALTIQWILKNYPTASIRDLEDSWTARRHRVGGQWISLDDIEHGTLRPLIGWKVHAVVVCAARSCPPLQPYAYTGDMLSEQIDQVYRIWFSRTDLNSFLPASNRVEISKIFNWYKEDFKNSRDIGKILKEYAPGQYRTFLKNEKYKIKYKEYHWGLNDQSDLGKDYKYSILRSLF